MSNPANPAQASLPVPPPLVKLPWATTADGQPVMLTPMAFGFLQTLWAAAFGNNGVLDLESYLIAELQAPPFEFSSPEAAALAAKFAALQIPDRPAPPEQYIPYLPPDPAPTGTGSGVTFTDGSNTVADATTLTVTGGTVGGSTPNATLSISGGGGADYVEFTPTGTGTITLSSSNVSFWSTARNLRIIIHGQTTALVGNSEVNLQYNADTGANYVNELYFGNNTAMSVFQEVSPTQTANHIGWLVGASGAANAPGYVELLIFDFKGTTYEKAFLAHSGLLQNTTSSGAFSRQTSGWWLNTAAVTSITLSLASGNWAAGTVISVQSP